MKLVQITLVLILLHSPIISIAGNTKKFPSVEAMIEKFNDYSVSNGTFKIIKNKPLHIQLSPQVVKGDFPEIIELQVKRALIYGIYRSYVHTNINNITVTAIPKEINFNNKKSKYLAGHKRTIFTTRSKALSLVKKYINVTSFSKLVKEEKMSGMVYYDQWIKDFDRIYYNDQGQPGLNRFISELAK
ncbi:MAG: hypothetical protein QM504_02945 [Pseudomonadota bacterium]